MRTCYGRGAPLRAAVYAACLSAFVFFGYDQGVLSGLLENEYFQRQFGNPVSHPIFMISSADVDFASATSSCGNHCRLVL